MSLSALSFRDIVATPGDTDVLQTSLEELHRRRRAKREEEQARQRSEQKGDVGEGADNWGFAQELAYRREVLDSWTRQYPKLREAMIATAATSSSAYSAVSPQNRSLGAAATTAPVGTTATAFSVAEAVRPSYPTLWRIPAGAIPADFYTRSVAMEISPLLSAPQRQHVAAVAMKDYSAHSCLVRVRWESIRGQDLSMAPSLSAAASLVQPSQHPRGSSSHSQLPRQRVLARWPQGKPASAKMATVLRSIGIEERKREQWNDHLRRQQGQQQKQDEQEAPQQLLRDRVQDGHSAVSVKLGGHLQSSPSGVEPATEAGVVGEFGSAVAAVSASGVVDNGGSGGAIAAGASESALGHELYWPAYITRTRALFTGASCLQDTFHGLDQLQQYEQFEPVLALALASPLRLVVDVVYLIDEVSETLGLSIDPVVDSALTTTLDARTSVSARGSGGHSVRSVGLGNGGGSRIRTCGTATECRGSLSPSAMPSSLEEVECPVLLPSALPPVLSDLNYAFTVTGTTTGTSPGGASADSRHTVSPITAFTEDSIATSTATLCRSTLSTNPVSLYAILAGPVSQTHTIVLLRPTPEVVCTARACALQELEKRWQRLRQAFVDRPVPCEQAPTTVLVRSPTLPPAPVRTVELPDADTYTSPFIDRSVRQDEGLPEEPVGAETLTDEEMQRQTRLPQLQGGHLPRRPPTYQVGGLHGVNKRLLQLAAASLQGPPVDPGLSTRRADRGAPSTENATGDSAGSKDRCGSFIRGSGLTSTAAAPHDTTRILRAPQLARSSVDPIALCPSASCKGLEVSCTDGTSADLNVLRNAPFSAGREAATVKSCATLDTVRASKEWLRAKESMTPAPQQPTAMRRAHTPAPTVEAPLSASEDAWRPERHTDHIGSATTAGSPGKVSPPSTSPPPERHRHIGGSPLDVDKATQVTDADSSRHSTCSDMEQCSAILSVSAQSLPCSQPMWALQDVSAEPRLPCGMRNAMNGTASQRNNTVDGGEQVPSIPGESGAALPTPLSPQLYTSMFTHLPLPSQFDKNRTLAMPNLSTPDIAATLASPSSTVSSPTSPPPHAASPLSRNEYFAAAAAPPHAEGHSKWPSSGSYPILQQSSVPLCHTDSASTQYSIRNTETQLSATPAPVPSGEPPPRLSRAASSSSSSDETRSVPTHTSLPAEKVLRDGAKKKGTLSAVPGCSDTRTLAHSTPHVTPATALESSSSSFNVPVLSGTATYRSNIQGDSLIRAAVAQETSAARRSGVAALSSPQAPHATPHEACGASPSTSGTSPSSSSTFLCDKCRVQPRNLEQPQREPMRRVSPLTSPSSHSLSTMAEAPACMHPSFSSPKRDADIIALSEDIHPTPRVAPGTAPRKVAVAVEVDPQQRPHLSERRSAASTRRDSVQYREHASPLESTTDAVGTTAASGKCRGDHGGSSGIGVAQEREGSPLPRRPPSPPLSWATGANNDAYEGASRPMSAKSTLSKSINPCERTSQPPWQHTDDAGSTGVASGEPRGLYPPQGSGNSRMRHRRLSPRAPKTAAAAAVDESAEGSRQRHQSAGSVSVAVLYTDLCAYVDREVELPEQPVGLRDVPTPHSPQQHPYPVTANVPPAKSVLSGETATGLHRRDEVMHSRREDLPETHHRATHPIRSRKASSGSHSSYQQAHLRHCSPDAAGRRKSPSSSSPVRSVSVTPRALPTSRMRHTAPPAVVASTISAPSSENSSFLTPYVASSMRGASPVPHPSSRASRSCRGSDGDLVVPCSHRSTSSSQRNRRRHDAVALSSPSSTPHRHRILVRRVVRRRRSDVFVEEGGSLVHRAPMTPSHLLRSSNSTERETPQRPSCHPLRRL
ncbi:hypothetical protein, conserved [Leishmania tarentolae]|uniref:Uncharacterized protein n=1 Tax=Leishmania tarentolae TaxID=5689 RepID=A0A640KE90_LEITA|nr:hypothetical protein, conserved [Leishmania tarentolae]